MTSVRSTQTSALRASAIADEKKRKEKFANAAVTVTRAQTKSSLQRKKDDEFVDKAEHRNREPVGATGRGKVSTDHKNPLFKESCYHDNLDFYRNKIRSKPHPGYTIEEMLTWKGNYYMLEINHRYIQWLFPISDGNGMNLYAQPLMDYEAQAIRNEKKTSLRVLKAYKMMLDFYGMQLSDSVHGVVERSSKGWKDRYHHLNWSRHNFLRITRILKSIGELGYDRYQAPWVHFLIQEAVVEKQLPNLNGGCLFHWICAVKDDREKELLYRKANGLPINEQNMTEDMNSESEDEVAEAEQNTKAVTSGTGKDNGRTLKAGSMDKAMLALKLEDNDREPVRVKKGDAKLGTEEMKCDATLMAACGEKPTECQLPSDNLKFYQNNLNSRPSPGYTIETMLKHKGDFNFFEGYPYFIQWLFPVPEKSVRNIEAQQLYDHEAKAIKEDDRLTSRVLEAYRLILDIYGMQLCDEIEGKIGRVKKTYKKRYEFLYMHTYNYLRITRVLKCLGELGFERFQVPLIDFLVKEGIDNEEFPTLDGACIMHWIYAIKDEGEKRAMFEKYQKLSRHQAVDFSAEESDFEEDFEDNTSAHVTQYNPPSILASDPTVPDGLAF